MVKATVGREVGEIGFEMEKEFLPGDGSSGNCLISRLMVFMVVGEGRRLADFFLSSKKGSL